MMPDTSYDFHEQLDKAIPDELETLNILSRRDNRFSGFIHKTDKNDIADAYNPYSKEWLEIKVDYKKLPNHFIERFSSEENKTPGGPWQYLERGVKYYVFYYKELRKIYVFETKILVDKINYMIKTGVISDEKNGKHVKQKNANYTTYGYPVRRELIDDICILKLEWQPAR